VTLAAARPTAAERIDGRAIALRLDAKTAAEVAAIVARDGVAPGLAVVLVGEDPASQIYVGRKIAA
jgi:methylenetetrahydrofolate dehydrogenase (NADP+) / methenyltetrahydrofolate cyclohydrolase